MKSLSNLLHLSCYYTSLFTFYFSLLTFIYFASFPFLRCKIEGINIAKPKIVIKIPDHRLILISNDLAYKAVLLPDVIPKIVSNIPKMENINPIGSFISKPIVIFF